MAWLKQMTETKLIAHLGDLVRADRENTVALIRCLAVVDERRTWAVEGYSSLFAMCVGRFGMSEECAAKRIRAARLARQFPEVLTMMEAGELHSSGLMQIAAHLTAANRDRLLAKVRGKTMKEIELVVAELAPRAEKRSRVTPVYVAPKQAEVSDATGAARETAPLVTPKSPPQASLLGLEVTTSGAVPGSELRETSQASGTMKYRLSTTIGSDAYATLERLKALMGHSVRSGDAGEIIERALSALLEKVTKQRTAKTDKPQMPRLVTKQRTAKTDKPQMPRPVTKQRTAETDKPQMPRPVKRESVGAVRHETDRARYKAKNARQHVPSAVRRAVWERDETCVYVSPSGHRCGERRKLELNHRKAFALGGASTTDNLELLCEAHNRLQATQELGATFVARKIAERSTAARRREVCSGAP